MNIKAMEQLEECRRTGYFNMWNEANHLLRWASDHDMHELVIYSTEKNWIDILNELSEYKEILMDFEQFEVDDMFGEYIEDSI
jgi:hypothetical protein